MRSGNTPGKSQGANRKRRNRSKGQEGGKAYEGGRARESGRGHEGGKGHEGGRGREGGKGQGRRLDYLAEARQKYQKERTDTSKNNAKGRLKWTAPKLSMEPLPVPVCPICGKPVKEVASAVNDRVSGEAAHFECVRDRVSQGEPLAQGEALAYIGGGRFGVIEFAGTAARSFKIKKIIEWEVQEKRAEWRAAVADHFSLT